MSTGPQPLEPSSLRQALAVVVAAAVTAVGALILGEYDFKGTTPYVAGFLFGLVVAEVVLTVARLGRPVLAAAAAALSGLGMLWAAWISSGRGVSPIPGGAYLGMLLAMAVAGGWVVAPTRRHRGGTSGP
ncbi:MAG: hypothetical protein ACYDH6_01175 [Acidimicrobiales bacterium]